ncbi:MAG: aldo/keto reductase [Candidatus Lokiarchaeota archaeon]|nr:aldo/keto reductase [Candidatus Lokiarchaeota archaeon]
MLDITSRKVLNSGGKMPVLGFGTYSEPPRDRVVKALHFAVDAGYRLVDTATIYQNERFIGRALSELHAPPPRDDLFITTKVWKDALRVGAVRESLEESLQNLGLDYVDLLLIHRPLTEFNLDAWHVMEDLQREGLARAIGVSNFLVKHLEALREASTTVPAVNQIELHPFFYRKELVDYCNARSIVVESYSPIALGKRLGDPRLMSIAGNREKTPSQVLIRWNLQHGWVPIPRSLSEPHIRENAAVFDFELSRAEMDEMDGWNEDFNVIGADPDEPDFR